MPQHNAGRRFAADLGHAVASLFRLAPAPAPRWAIGLRAAIAMAVPIALMTLLGRADLGFQAATGAFVALYGTHLQVRERARVVPFVAGGLGVAAVLGALAGPSPVWTLIGLAVVALVAAVAMFGFAVGPPGPLFVVLVYGLSAHIVASGADAATYVVAVACGILFASIVSLAPLVLASRRRVATRPLREVLPGPAWPPGERMLVIRVALVTVVGIAVGLFVDPDRAYWIVGAAIAVVGVAADRRAAFSRGLHRMIGTILGAGVYLLLAPLPIPALWLALLLGVLQFTIELFVVRNYALALVFITPLVLLLTGAATGAVDTVAVATERVIDTLAGAVLGAASGVLHARDEPA
ncbi:putative membrane protein YccC [Microbacterium sp. BE35]|uniref:FUSC family protein n=1 Tax=Microbacterium sp. BE35 TaxID=2817773 RepID=UPI002854CC7C|nr:FUSC family protein [Microbacterium sp. BE35]MDR7188522.1 putative membrane protein YccC [Microbacterium sp. BE35]